MAYNCECRHQHHHYITFKKNTKNTTDSTTDNDNSGDSDNSNTLIKKWISYAQFTPNTVEDWGVSRETIGPDSIFNLNKLTFEAMVDYLNTNISFQMTQPYRLTQLILSYEIETADLDAVSCTLTLIKHFADSTPEFTSIAIDPVILSNEIGIHYETINVIESITINDDEYISLEMKLELDDNSFFKFYGCSVTATTNVT